MNLPAPARYFPLANGLYEVSAGLRPFGTDFGNGAADAHVFLFDTNYANYRVAKLRARTERLETYYPAPSRLDERLRAAVVRFICERLAQESPTGFRLKQYDGGYMLESMLTDETFRFSPVGELLPIASSMEPPYRDAIDALATLLQEDIAIWQRDPQSGDEWLACVHLCFPNHWAAEDKIGRAFNMVHSPVAGFGRLAKAAPSLVDGMISKGPFVRFAWGVATDCELNHHPRAAFQGRQFDPQKPELFLRIERQTLHGFAPQHGALFTIRTFFLNCATDLSNEERRSLSSAIESMSPESRVYKGLSSSREAILKWLRGIVG